MKVEELNEKLITGNREEKIEHERRESRGEFNGEIRGGYNRERREERKRTSFNVDMKELRVKNLRKMKVRGTMIPNLKSKLWALRLQDEISTKEVFNLPEKEGAEEENGLSPPPT